ncbi:polysaccharide pyruvyl transferase family protein [Akkermansiaceae bacterium]|nr:polysaccharide pyruvyl transferase family protein [Akkermansiaceae bacterium]MDA7933545.1 polysaccharide pyruvyl transferase family protein [Akkermansiaceae bacterium]MDB4423427.1 polysaccharide pyruvyl transferase family protein [bacterium]
MKILHTYCLNYNVGDYALGYGVKNVLRSHLHVDFISQTNIQGRDFNEYYIDEVVNKRYDLLVIGGGGIIHGAHWPQGWFWLIEKELISRIKIPFIVYGAGYNYFEGEGDIPDRGVEHLKLTQEHARYFSVRNDGSYERLLNATEINANVIPDPGFHVPLGRDWGAPVEGDFVVVQLADDKSDFRYGGEEKKMQFVHRMRGVISDLAKKYKVIVLPHVFDDIRISEQVTEGIENAHVLNFSSYAFDQCEEVMKYYRDARLVLAMRGHGQIVPLGFRTPVVTFSAHDKVGGMMQSLGLSHYHADLHSDEFTTQVLDIVEEIEANREAVVVEIDKLMVGLENDTLREFDAVKRLIQ